MRTRFAAIRRLVGERPDRGTALIEFALVAPVLVLLALGVLEYGNAFRQVNGIEQAVGQAARTASTQANNRFADYEALRTLSSAVENLSGVEVDWVTVYRVDSSDPSVPDACRSASVPGTCNRYTGEQVMNASLAQFPGGSASAPSCAGGIDAAFCPVTQRSRTSEPPTVIGVHLAVTYEPVTGIWPGPSVSIERYAIYQIEPCSRGVAEC